MAGVELGALKRAGRRAVDTNLNLIPLIDLLLVTIAFLLITAVWVTESAIAADAIVPGPPRERELTPQTPEKILHVYMDRTEFVVAWKQGATMVVLDKVPKSALSPPASEYKQLEALVIKQWEKHGAHQQPSDRKLDRAVVHADDKLPFKDLVRVLDAIAATRRRFSYRGHMYEVPAFDTTFATR
jgi:biopolymer transport protein ExbD